MTRKTGSYRKIGLTGGIGSGKSTVAGRLAALGAHVYDADEISRRALDHGGACYDRVVEMFGEEIVGKNGEIDRKRLAQIVFSDEERREALNAIVHPYVTDELFARAERDLGNAKNGTAIFEVPLLFESGMDALMDETILVSSNEENRIRRVMERSGLSRDQVVSRMRAQMPEEQKRMRADHILENDGTPEELLFQVDALYEILTAEDTQA